MFISMLSIVYLFEGQYKNYKADHNKRHHEPLKDDYTPKVDLLVFRVLCSRCTSRVMCVPQRIIYDVIGAADSRAPTALAVL
jgi:hypothetical protein